MAKKSFKDTPAFKDNPALMFISGAEEAEAPATEQKAPTDATAPEGYKLNPLYIETKSKRLQLVLQPSVLERVRARAAESGLSVNEYCHRVLDKATREE